MTAPSLRHPGLRRNIIKAMTLSTVKMFKVIWVWFSEGAIYQHLWVTLEETALAFGIGAALGLAMGLWLGLSPTASALFDPYITAMNAANPR